MRITTIFARLRSAVKYLWPFATRSTRRPSSVPEPIPSPFPLKPDDAESDHEQPPADDSPHESSGGHDGSSDDQPEGRPSTDGSRSAKSTSVPPELPSGHASSGHEPRLPNADTNDQDRPHSEETDTEKSPAIAQPTNGYTPPETGHEPEDSDESDTKSAGSVSTTTRRPLRGRRAAATSESRMRGHLVARIRRRTEVEVASAAVVRGLRQTSNTRPSCT